MNAENKIRAAFGSVEAGEGLKDAVRGFLQQARQKEEKRLRQGMRRRAAAVAACAVMLMLAVGISGYTMLLVPFSYVSIDVNPSIELELNRIDRVISAKAYNEDGEKLLDSLSVDGKYYTDAIDILVESREMQPYLEGDAALTITVASESGRRENALLDGVRNSASCMRHGGMSTGTDLAMVEEAHECGLSLGKYAAYRILQQYVDDITPADCHDMTMSEIRGLIQEHGHDENGGWGGGHGSGWHWGSDSGDGTSGAGGTDSGDGAPAWGGTDSGGHGSGGAGHGYGHGREH